MIKPWGKNLIRTRIFTKYLPIDYLLITKEEMRNFQ